MLPPLVLLFVIVPLVELAVILQVGSVIGTWWTIGILVADSVFGAVLMRTQGRAAWRRFAGAARAGRPPAREVIDGALIIAGGALLLTPGFVTDILGILLLLPPTRAVLRGMLARKLTHRMIVSMTSARRAPRTRPDDVDGSASSRPRPDTEPYRLP